MNIEGKLVAPKPIKKISKFSTLKIRNHELSNSCPSTLTKSENNKLIKNFGFKFDEKLFELFDEIQPNTPENNKIATPNLSSHSELEFELERNLSNETAKCEILHILKQKDSLPKISKSCSFFNDNLSDKNTATTEDENLRGSIPPSRTNNPFYKNFEENSEGEDEFAIIKCHSSQLFKNKGVIDG